MRDLKYQLTYTHRNIAHSLFFLLDAHRCSSNVTCQELSSHADVSAMSTTGCVYFSSLFLHLPRTYSAPSLSSEISPSTCDRVDYMGRETTSSLEDCQKELASIIIWRWILLAKALFGPKFLHIRGNFIPEIFIESEHWALYDICVTVGAVEVRLLVSFTKKDRVEAALASQYAHSKHNVDCK